MKHQADTIECAPRQTPAERLQASWEREQHTRHRGAESDGSAAAPVPMLGKGDYRHGCARVGGQHG